MKRYLLIGCVTALFGCNDIETALVIENAVEGSSGAMSAACVFDSSSETGIATIQYDAADTDTLALQLRVRNTLQAGMIKFSTGDIPDTFIITNEITPVRFDLRWECDSSGFSDDLGPLFLPQFSTDDPFCLTEDTRTFAGFDVIPATGYPIQPGGTGLVLIRPITAQLGRAFQDVFILAREAQRCCDEAAGTAGGNCDDGVLQSRGGPICNNLQNLFDAVAGPDQLSARSFVDLQKFRPFQAFDGMQLPPSPGQILGPSYPLRLRGVLQAVTSDGSIVGSTEWAQDIHICTNCGGSSPCTGY